MMKVSHVLYKVDHLEAAVANFKKQGFKVEYGSKSRPHNALIYFSEGPYIELLSKAPVAFYVNPLLRLLGKGKVADRFSYWSEVSPGYFGLCLEHHGAHFMQEETILKNKNQQYFITKSSRTDPSGRRLKWKLLFPYELKLPFMMTYFNIDPKPQNFVHPNGVKRIDRITFGTEERLFEIIHKLCNDDILKLVVGRGVQNVIFDK
ncbi:MAG: VOC family protein [Cyclobacteriaceae bacterium]